MIGRIWAALKALRTLRRRSEPFNLPDTHRKDPDHD